MKILTLLFLSFLFVSCATVPKASKELDLQAKTFQPVEDKAVLYIFRDEYFGAALKKQVSMDGKIIGATGPQTFIRVETSEGKHRINSNDEDILEIDVIRGKIYYVRQEIKTGVISGSSKLYVVDEARGKNGVMDSVMISKWD